MKFSTKAEYGLKAITNLAACYPDTKSIKTISKEEHISLKYLERIFSVLRESNLVKSYRGKAGGYSLHSHPSKIKVGEVIEILEGPITPMGCSSSECALRSQCASSSVWITLEAQINKTLNGILLSDLIK